MTVYIDDKKAKLCRYHYKKLLTIITYLAEYLDNVELSEILEIDPKGRLTLSYRKFKVPRKVLYRLRRALRRIK
ncbi:MAG: hypothetical protein DRP01_00550 [Archaeoglobales archaeon]|nr:MAG: hypothetical protein DRP01_00550 [Archaeoglobales archaeon]